MATANHENLRTYRPELDAVRFCAFFLVFLAHTLPSTPRDFGRHSAYELFSPAVWRILVSIEDACLAGLPLFFMLSAYLITSLLLQEREQTGGINIRNFYLRRVLRIWPLYFLGLAVGVAFSFIQHTPADASRFLWYLIILGNLYALRVDWTTNPMVPLWSISLEEQFYLFWPWAMKYLSRRWLTIVAVLMIAIANVVLYCLGLSSATKETAAWCNSFVQFQMFAVGILMALHLNSGPPRRWLGALSLISAPLCWFCAAYFFHVMHTVPMVNTPLNYICGYALFALGAGLFLNGFILIGPKPLPRWLPNLGKISYGLYVYHALAMYIVSRIFALLFGSRFPYLIIVFGYLLLLLIAKLSYKYFEKPFLVLKTRFEAVHTKPV